MHRFKKKLGQNGRGSDVLKKIWGLGDNGHQLRPEQQQAYINHYLHSLQSDPQLSLSLDCHESSDNIISLVEVVRASRQLSMESVCSAIRVASDTWTTSPLDEGNQFQALQLAVKLWLFTDIQSDHHELTLAEHVQRQYSPAASQHITVPSSHIRWLSQDFSAKSLTRKGGLYLVWTSDLSKHLTFASKDQLQVFPHAQVLRQYQDGVEVEMYPDNFLNETYRTIHLLFPCEDVRISKRVQREAQRRQVDIEAYIDVEKAVEHYVRFDISTYPFYGSRLAEIQRRYDHARPRRIQQWWYNRRRRHEWGALMVALVVFVLTIFFGLISSITGIMQVWASFQALKRR